MVTDTPPVIHTAVGAKVKTKRVDQSDNIHTSQHKWDMVETVSEVLQSFEKLITWKSKLKVK